MNSQELITLAWNSLKANKLRSLLTTLGIIIGVFAVILLVSIGSGLQSYITDQIAGLGSNLIFVIPGRVGGARTPGGVVSNKLELTDATNLQIKLKNIADVGPVIEKTALIKRKNLSDEGVSVLGSSSNYPTLVKTDIDRGIFFTKEQERGGAKVALIGPTVATNLFPGEPNDIIGQKITVTNARLTVIGILAKKGAIFGLDQDNSIIIPVTTAKQLFGINNVNTIYISAKSAALVPLVKEQTNAVLLKRLTSDDFSLQTQESALSTVSNITGILTVALGGIAMISLLVGGIGIMNIMLVSVTERTKEIGLRKALGARRSDILTQFLLEAIILSLSGGFIGIVLGMLSSYILSQFFISQVTPWSVVLAFLFSVAVGIVFGMAPALKASKLSPIEALRYE